MPLLMMKKNMGAVSDAGPALSRFQAGMVDLPPIRACKISTDSFRIPGFDGFEAIDKLQKSPIPAKLRGSAFLDLRAAEFFNPRNPEISTNARTAEIATFNTERRVWIVVVCLVGKVIIGGSIVVAILAIIKRTIELIRASHLSIDIDPFKPLDLGPHGVDQNAEPNDPVTVHSRSPNFIMQGKQT
jgi:hypothetical protein